MLNFNTKKIYFSLKTKVTLIIVFFLLTMLAIVFSISFISIKKIVREDISLRLLNIVSISALQVNAEEHSLLRIKSDDNTVYFNDIKKTLKNIKKNVTDIHYIYTMRENADNEITFIVDPDDEDPNDITYIGEVYDTSSQFLKGNFLNINNPVIEKDFYTDKWGTWLSGYAPFYNKDGKREGVLGIDFQASNIKNLENNILYIFFIAYLIFSAFSILLGMFFSKKLIKSISNLTNFVQGDNSSKAKMTSFDNDEIGRFSNVLKDKLGDMEYSEKEKESTILEKNKELERMNELMVGRELEMIKLKEEIKELKKSN